MNRLKTVIVLALPLLFLGVIPLSLGRAWPDVPFYLGDRINIMAGEPVTVSSSDYSCLWHGWNTLPRMWSDMSGQERARFMGPGLGFELETDLPWQHPLQYQSYYVKLPEWDFDFSSENGL